MAYRDNTGGYESIRMVNGREFACYMSDFKNPEIDGALPRELLENCVDVSTIIGTERW